LESTRRGRRYRATASFVSLLAALVLVSGCGDPAAPAFTDLLHVCSADEGPTDAYCGTYQVFEDRGLGSGKTIRLSIVVLPSIGADVRPDPLVFLAGGPGQGAARMASLVQAAFRSVQRNRDVVLVDQRGTGRSNPLNCRSSSDSLAELSESDDQALEKLKKCLATLPGDPRLYTTTIAMDDLDDVREFLGYDKVNLYGGSYGTRAALVYLRQHPEHVRTVVLDGVAPTDMSLPLFAARDAQRSLDKLANDCANDPACRAAYPGLGERVRKLFARLDAKRPKVRLVHPRTGEAEEVELRASVVASMIFGALYSPLTSSILPSLLERAEHDDFQGLLALAYMTEGTTDNMSLGMQLSVLCSEDSPRYTSGDLHRESAGTVFGAGLMMGQARACEFWPKGKVDPSYYEPVKSDTPTLVLSGDLDPVTPPTWGQAVTQSLTNVRHYTMPGTGHGVMATACGNKLIAQFIERGSVDNLADQCIGQVKRPGFFLTPAGPEPALVAGAAP
jgi:pimeloyl-ACP methyl ester carboxylesterase